VLCNTVGASCAILMSKYFLRDVFVPGTFLGNTLETVKEKTKVLFSFFLFEGNLWGPKFEPSRPQLVFATV
jgi:hypothetical protein